MRTLIVVLCLVACGGADEPAETGEAFPVQFGPDVWCFEVAHDHCARCPTDHECEIEIATLCRFEIGVRGMEVNVFYVLNTDREACEEAATSVECGANFVLPAACDAVRDIVSSAVD